MKKLLFLIALSSCFPASSCSSKIDKIPLFHSPLNIQTIESEERYYANELTAEDIESLISKKADFFLYVYVPGCGTCELFPITLNNYIKETNAVINYCLSGTFNSVDGVNDIFNSSFVFFNDGKISHIEDLSPYTLDTDAFAEMMDEYTFDTGVEIINPVYMENYFSIFYRSFVFKGFTDEKPEEGYYFSNDLNALLADTSILLVAEEKTADLNDVIAIHEENPFVYLGFISQDLASEKEVLKETFKISDFSTYTYITYKEGEVLSVQSFD